MRTIRFSPGFSVKGHSGLLLSLWLVTVLVLVGSRLASAAAERDDTVINLQASTPSALVSVSTSGRGRTFDRMLFGGFLEHYHRQIYGGIFEPGSPLADGIGVRKDVIAAIRELRTPIVRWPGGCFVSAYHWKDQGSRPQ